MILWAHGLEGSPEGTKASALRAAGFELLAPDGRGKVLALRIAELDRVSAELAGRRVLLAGSSYGGLAAAWLAQERPERFCGLLLLAPALHHREAPALEALRPPPGLPVIVLHGALDEVVPVQASRDYVAGSHAQLRIQDDGHALADSLPALIAAARELLH